MKTWLTVLIIGFFFLSTCTAIISVNLLESKSMKPRRFIIDTDAGADDALAILLALNYEAIHKTDIEIIAITCTHGNTNEKNVEANVLKTLTIAKRNNIPVYGGAERSLVNDFIGFPFFGNDGLGDFIFEEKLITSVDNSKYAAVALIDLVKLHSGEVSIIAIGPLTNLALAIRLDSTFINHVDEIIIMGSSVAGVGNEGPNIEFNFAIDPESNFIVMDSLTKPCILLPWETVLFNNPGKEWRQNVFAKLNSSSVDFLNKAEVKSLKNGKIWSGVDALAVAIAIWPNIIKNSTVTRVIPVYDGAAKGSVLIDYKNKTGKPNNARIIQSYDVTLYKEILLEYFSG